MSTRIDDGPIHWVRKSETTTSSIISSPISVDIPPHLKAKQCPWCGKWACKDNRCDYIFACGLGDDDKFHIGAGCGHAWCWHPDCGKKYCGQMYDPLTGIKISDKTMHDDKCCRKEPDFSEETYCPGGHSPHCAKRW